MEGGPTYKENDLQEFAKPLALPDLLAGRGGCHDVRFTVLGMEEEGGRKEQEGVGRKGSEKER